MADPISSIQGLASGIQWKDLVTQLMSLESARRLDPINATISANTARTTAWSGVQAQITKITDAAKALHDGTAFDAFTATVGASPTSGRTLLSATVGAGAAATTSSVEVVSLAQAEKVSSNVVTDPALALGYSGDIVINQHKVTIAAADSLNAVRDKINGANAGTVPSGVTASILSNNGTSRLVLSSDNTGSSGVEMVDSATSGGVLQQLGLIDGTTAQNTAANGGAQSHQFSSITASIAAALGVTVPPPSSITVNGVTISVDLAIDSLASIVAKINAAGGQATTTTESVNGASKSRMNVGGTVGGDARTLQLLGLTDGGRGNVAQVKSTSRTLQDGAGATAAASTLMTALKLNGSSANVQVGDTVTIAGTKGDGTVVNINYTVAAGDTLSTFLTKINNNVDGFGAGARTATASLTNGKILLTDNTTGDSQLNFSLKANNQGGGTLDFGTTSTTVTGRKREVTSGTNAQVRVDGVLISRQTNTISDAITGVTLNLQAAEVGTTVSLNVARDDQKTVDSVKAFAKTYNDLKALVDKDVAAGGPLAFDSTAKGVVSNMKQYFLQKIDGLGLSSYDHATIAGVSFDKVGVLQVDETKLKSVLQTNREDVRRLFATKGASNNSELSYFSSTGKTVSGSYAVNITGQSTIAKNVGVGFNGTIANDAGPDQMRVTDSISGNTAIINVAIGDTTANIVTNLNAAFTAQGMSTIASNVGGQVKIASTTSGANSFTVGYTVVSADNTTQIGLPAGTYSGTASTTASKTGTGFSGTMLGDTQADTMSILDSVTGNTATVNIATGNTTANIVTALNTAFGAQGMNLTASNSGGQVKIQSNLNNSGSYTVSYGVVGYDQTAQLGLAAGTYAGTKASVQTSTLGGNTVATGALDDNMKITDSLGRVANVAILAAGMTTAQLVTAINTQLTAGSLN
ncbi:MAG: flagellar filament capping protein FliD, partial [Gemmatimonadota bacterium]|nr:flagellar filament capping protein FliD [Gemmatimonadota bacterium]